VRLRFAAAATFGLALIGAGAAMGDTMRHPPSPIEQAYRAGKAAGGDDMARGHYQRGIDLARQALARSPDQPDALLWLAANLAGEALTHGKLRALRVIPEIERTLLRLEQVAPHHDHAAAARGLANLYWKAPALISVGSSKKAAAFFELALQRAPDFPGNQAQAAAFFASTRNCARAAPLAAAVTARRDLDAYGPDAAEWRQLAQEILRDCR
jgi:hypothetical protein